MGESNRTVALMFPKSAMASNSATYVAIKETSFVGQA
jgi:hypothetical protein